jgi:hypothetical protein
MYGGGSVESSSEGPKVNFEPGSGCGAWGKGTSRMVPMGVVLVTHFFCWIMLPASSFTSPSVIVLVEA